MKDYYSNNSCDFLWINELLELKKNSQKKFTSEFKKNDKTTSLSVVNVTIFGTIVAIKQIANKGYLYHVDDGTGVIGCKHSEDQFEEVISVIENEQCEILNQTFNSKQNSEQCSVSNISGDDDSIFNDKSIQNDEVDGYKQSQLLDLQSIWDNIYSCYTNLMGNYKLGDTVVVEGRLYSYFNVNQIYVNIIRPMELEEEIIRISTKLEDGYDCIKGKDELKNEKRMSGLMTFDHIHHLSARFPPPRDIRTPEQKAQEDKTTIFTPNLNSNITFDTLPNNM